MKVNASAGDKTGFRRALVGERHGGRERLEIHDGVGVAALRLGELGIEARILRREPVVENDLLLRELRRETDEERSDDNADGGVDELAGVEIVVHLGVGMILMQIFKVVSVDADVLRLAVDFHDKDFEDDIQLQCALKAKCTQLFTRNPNHYDNSLIAVVPPSAFMP